MLSGGLICKGQLLEEVQECQLEQLVVLMGILLPERGHSFSMVEGTIIHQGNVTHAGKKDTLLHNVTLEGSFKGIAIIVVNGVIRGVSVGHKKYMSVQMNMNRLRMATPTTQLVTTTIRIRAIMSKKRRSNKEYTM